MAIIRKLSKRERNVAAVTAVIIGAAVFYNMIIEPVAGNWHRLDKELKVKMNSLKKDMAMLPSCKAIESDYAKFSVYTRAKKNEEEDVSDMLAAIEALSRQDSCLIVNIKPSGVKKSGACKEIMVDLNVEASLAQLSKFLYDIETQKNMVLKVHRFTINSTQDPQNSLKGSFLISRIVIE